MAILSKGCKQDELHNSVKLSFTNILGLHSNFVECESFLESFSPNILALCETNLHESADSANFFVRGYFPLIEKDSVMVLQFVRRNIFLSSRDLLMFSTAFISFSVLLLFPLSITFFIFMHGFHAISSNIDEVILINPSATVFAFEDFTVHHKDWLLADLFLWNWWTWWTWL